MKAPDLNRFVEAQKTQYQTALSEIRNGRKRSHWMWYIFPQIRGLGISETSRFYSIENLKEAEAFLDHPVLGVRLVEISNALLDLKTNDAYQIFGSPDDLKLRSSLTLFSAVPTADPVFRALLEKYFDGKADAKTMQLLSRNDH